MLQATIRTGTFALLLLALNCGPVAAQAQQDDHPLLTRYIGSEIADKQVAEFDSYQLVMAVTPQGEFTGENLEGKVTRIVYQNPAERSTLEIFSNYRQALSAAGMEILYECALDDCGPSYARSAWNRFNGLFAAADGDPRYLSGRLATADGTAYVAVMVGRRRTQLDVIEIVGMQEDMVVVDAAALAREIEQAGTVSVYGIFFDTDKSDIKPESKPALDEIARMLQEQPTLRLYVVGHTDMSGELQYNRNLSEARARAVVAALVQDYAIADERLQGLGVGPLAPLASNANEAGRAKNRRVELVAR